MPIVDRVARDAFMGMLRAAAQALETSTLPFEQAAGASGATVFFETQGRYRDPESGQELATFSYVCLSENEQVPEAISKLIKRGGGGEGVEYLPDQ